MKLFRIFKIIIITLVIAFLVKKFLVEPIYIASGSMEPTLSKGHHFILDKITYKLRKPQRQEIICFKSPVGEPHDSIKRIIAVEGDTIEIRKKKVYLNEEPLVETYTKYVRANEILEGDNLGPLTVPKNHLFVLGDNRDESNDSATWKNSRTGERIYFIELSSVKGKLRGFY